MEEIKGTARDSRGRVMGIESEPMEGLIPAPRYDKVYEDGLKNMNEGEANTDAVTSLETANNPGETELPDTDGIGRHGLGSTILYEPEKPDAAINAPVKHLSSREKSNLNLRPPFPKGVSGNPKGRPKNEKCITALLRRKLNETDDKGVTWAERITDAMLVKAASADSTKGTASVLKEVLERTEGKVTEDINIRSEGNVILHWHPTEDLQDE